MRHHAHQACGSAAQISTALCCQHRAVSQLGAGLQLLGLWDAPASARFNCGSRCAQPERLFQVRAGHNDHASRGSQWQGSTAAARMGKATDETTGLAITLIDERIVLAPTYPKLLATSVAMSLCWPKAAFPGPRMQQVQLHCRCESHRARPCDCTPLQRVARRTLKGLGLILKRWAAKKLQLDGAKISGFGTWRRTSSLDLAQALCMCPPRCCSMRASGLLMTSRAPPNMLGVRDQRLHAHALCWQLLWPSALVGTWCCTHTMAMMCSTLDRERGPVSRTV